MSKTEIILFVMISALAGIKLYQKYSKKKSGQTDPYTKKDSGSAFSSNSKDDDYEPYSKK